MVVPGLLSSQKRRLSRECQRSTEVEVMLFFSNSGGLIGMEWIWVRSWIRIDGMWGRWDLPKPGSYQHSYRVREGQNKGSKKET